jgi:hypothetical protein
MTAWADYRYYTDDYLAGREPTVSEADFTSYAVSATATVRLWAGASITEDNIPDEARRAVCELAETFAAHDAAALASGGIASEKTGDLSVTYEGGASRRQNMRAAAAEIIRKWLTPGGYLHMGG